MIKAFSLLFVIVLFLAGCQSKEDKLKSSLEQILLQHIKQEQINLNGSANVDTCNILQVDTINERQMDDLMLSKIRLQRATLDSLADDHLKRGNVYNHQAYSYQKSGDTTAFNLAILNATDSHYQAGTFIDSSMAIQRTATYLKEKMTGDPADKKYFQAQVYLKATFFTNTDSSTVKDTVYYYFDQQHRLVDVDKNLAGIIHYDWE